MIKVGLYLENKRIANVDISEPQQGNPGIGGTEYNFISMPYNFIKHFPNKVEFTFLANVTQTLPKCFPALQVDSFSSALKLAEREGLDFLIWRPTLDENVLRDVEAIGSSHVQVIAWVHNTPDISCLDMMSKTRNLRRFVAVSHEQVDVIREHPIIYKASVIPNGFDSSPLSMGGEICKDPTMVVYTGSLVPAKGFGLLAEIWPSVLESVPEASLYVIGSGKLYNRSAVLGKWGVASESFEAEQIRPYLSDERGNVIPSVHFLGTLGQEKNGYLIQASVGVVNPSGLTENCPGSAIEFQAAKTPVISAAENGLLDTVVHHETGILCQNKQELIEGIVHFLKNPNEVLRYGENGQKFVGEKFEYGEISSLWFDLFSKLKNGGHLPFVAMKKNIFYKKKWLRELLRLTKAHLHEKLPEKNGLDDNWGESELKFLSSVYEFLDDVLSQKSSLVQSVSMIDSCAGNEVLLNSHQDIMDRLESTSKKNTFIKKLEQALVVKDKEIDAITCELNTIKSELNTIKGTRRFRFLFAGRSNKQPLRRA